LTQQTIIPVILSGGAGTRLWPSSRKAYPKQFSPLFDNTSTFSSTLKRISNPGIFAAPIVVTGWEFRFLVADELAEAGLAGRIVLEPLRRDSGPAIAIAGELAQQVDPDAVLLILAADHLVRDVSGFESTVLAGVAAAQKGYIVTFGVTPDTPATGFGYIQPGGEISKGVYTVARFVEKPNLSKAETLIRNGCLWNSGNFLCKASTLLSELIAFVPDIAAAAKKASQSLQVNHVGSISLELIDADIFGASPAQSIDFAVMEKTKLGAVVAVRHDWSDLGSWDALWQVSRKDEHGNVVKGAVTVSDTTNSFVSSDGIHTVVIGLEGLAIVATPDAVLVAPRLVAAELKPLVALLESHAATQKLTLNHRRQHQDWGSEECLLRQPTLVVKHLHIRPGAKLALHKHLSKQSHYYVAKGTCTASVNGKKRVIHEAGSFSVLQREAHSILNAHTTALDVIKTETGQNLSDDDTVWLPDDDS
jgi:mannose-1-phosphate guanylyltransferase / mannose-6-phosphate isomerase